VLESNHKREEVNLFPAVESALAQEGTGVVDGERVKGDVW
jgi:hypothetical protein